MNKIYRMWVMLVLLLTPILACTLPVPSLSRGTETLVPVMVGGEVQNGSGNQVSSTITATPSPDPSPSPDISPTPSVTPTSTSTFTPTPARAGTYLVKQIQTLGGESISGAVCNTLRPFDVTYVTPKVTFVTHYYPADGGQGKWGYAYSISSAGESHEANGSYTLKPTDQPGVLLLTMSGSDHVVFHGYDGKIPSRYKFDLVEAPISNCP